MQWRIICLSCATERSVKAQSMIDVLIIGGDSMIGSALFKHLKQCQQTVVATTRNKVEKSEQIFLDMAAPIDDWPDLPSAKTWVIVAAIARLAECRKDPEASYKVNFLAVKELTQRAKESRARVVFLSSDKVFDGLQKSRSEEDPTCPQSEYGRQKASAEKIVLNTSHDNLVIRLTKVLSQDDSLFTAWRDAFMHGEPVKAFTDMTLAPVSIDTVVIGISRAINKNISGILHFSGPKDTTYATAALHYAKLLGAQLENVMPIEASQFGIPCEERPPFSSLNSERATKILDLKFDPLNTLLRNMLEVYQSKHTAEINDAYGA